MGCKPVRTAAITVMTCCAMILNRRLSQQHSQNIKFGGVLVYLKYWTQNLKPLMVYPKVLYLHTLRSGAALCSWAASKTCLGCHALVASC